jgi:RNA polymerase sigma factor (sigma-70 family)
MSPQVTSESEFQALVARGEHRRAAEWLVLRYADEVMGLCLAMVRNRSTAEDLVQDVFGRAFLGLKSFRGDASARTWLLTIARNRCFDYLRARKREPWGAPGSGTALEPDSVPEDVPLPSELLARRADVEAARDELPEADRALIVLRFRNGLDYAELAIAFGLKPGAVRMRVSRSLNKMRRALEVREVQERVAEAAMVDEDFAPPPQAAPEPPADDDFADYTGAASGEVAEEFEEFAALDGEAPEFEPAPAPEPEAAPASAADLDWEEPTPPMPPRQAPAPPSAPRRPEPAAVRVLAKRAAEPPARSAAMPPPPAAQRAPGAAPAKAAPSPIFVRPPAPPAPPVEHPLTAFFAATRDALSNDLRNRLLDGARQA